MDGNVLLLLNPDITDIICNTNASAKTMPTMEDNRSADLIERMQHGAPAVSGHIGDVMSKGLKRGNFVFL